MRIRPANAGIEILAFLCDRKFMVAAVPPTVVVPRERVEGEFSINETDYKMVGKNCKI